MNSSMTTEVEMASPAKETQKVELEALCREIRERACTGEFDQQAFVSQDIIDKLKQIGVYRALLPKRFGGDEVSPRRLEESGDLLRRLSRLTHRLSLGERRLR